MITILLIVLLIVSLVLIETDEPIAIIIGGVLFTVVCVMGLSLKGADIN